MDSLLLIYQRARCFTFILSDFHFSATGGLQFRYKNLWVNVPFVPGVFVFKIRDLLQNMEVLLKMGKYTGITSELALPTDNKKDYIPVSKRAPVTAQVIIGTPGTINKWIKAKKLGTSQMKILVFDEADHMLGESGFREDSVRALREIVKESPDCQQFKVKVPDELSKIIVIKNKIMEIAEKLGQTIKFVRIRRSAEILHEALVKYGYEVTTIQGTLTLEHMDKIVKEFKDGLTQVLISTDLLARGFDQSKVNLVVNYDLPVNHECDTKPDNEVRRNRDQAKKLLEVLIKVIFAGYSSESLFLQN
ncbi:hypothetical protein L2E82_24870 [Cichorium intybus]|uniref:Uncharacterized protein n=1 Tax=Cichorium intybus TaxID=13427 RepID=A0ACB9E2Y2_CICIN|nr:hypothetical protein L2E82_24870 [Cichorium intybus]